MATARQRFFPVHTRVYRESWAREQKLAFVMLGCLMTDRWASDRLTDEQATRARLSPADLLEVTGFPGEEGVKLLRSLSRDVSLKVRLLGNGYCEVHWPKFLDSLRSRRPYNARELPANGPGIPPSSSSSSSEEEEKNSEKNTHIEENAEGGAGGGPADAGRAVAPFTLRAVGDDPPPRKRGRAPMARTAAPDDLTAEQWNSLWGAVWKHTPWLLVPRMEEVSPHCHPRWVRFVVRETLSYWRREQKPMADWVATALHRVFKLDADEWVQKQKSPPPSTVHFHATEPAPDYVPREVAESCARAVAGRA